MKLSVIGCGYLGAVHAASMASLGHHVVGVDTDAAKIDKLIAGKAPFFEPDLDDLLAVGLASGRLTFSTNPRDVKGATVHFIAVGTPQLRDSDGADMQYVDAAVEALVPHLSPEDVVVGKSTVPVGTARRLADVISHSGAHLVWNPEFLREGFAIQDTLEPDRLVYGVSADSGEYGTTVLDEVYANCLASGTPRLVTDYATAELVKVAANSFLATKISFINAMAEIAEATGADITQLADAIGHDARIGRKFLNAGIGFGGGCLPKDIRAFKTRAEELGLGKSLAFLTEVDAINLRRRQRVVDLVTASVNGEVANRRITILGLAFKPNSDDIRDSPGLDIALRLLSQGAKVVAYDPEAMPNVAASNPELPCAPTLQAALRAAETVVLATEWTEFCEIDPAEAASHVERPVLIDGRNALDPAGWREAGWAYHGLGR